MEKKLVSYLKNFQLSDLIGFSRILQVPEQDSFVDFLVDIVEAFSKKNRKARKELLKLAKDISLNNQEFDSAATISDKNGE